MQTLAQICIRYTRHSRPRAGLFLLHSHFGRQPAKDRGLHPRAPTFVVSKHPVSVQNFAALATNRQASVRQHVVNICLKLDKSGCQSIHLDVGILGHRIGNNDMRLV